MADKKRNKNQKHHSSKKLCLKPMESYDGLLEHIKQETLAAVVENETYPRAKNETETEDDTHIYYTARERYKKTGRYEQSPDTVAQHMQDRTQFRH
ncbi:MAG: hypothetical protein E7483_03025 [Ruminococcaceae bacterium]|nr:hypothetical protein [Oscillospiraceae bacterium]